MFKKLKIKKIIKIFSWLLVILGIIILCAEVTLRCFLPVPSVKAKILNKISDAIGAQLTVGEVSASLFGAEIDNVILGINEDNFITLKKLKIRQNPLKLLKGQISVKHIYIDEPVFQIIRYKDGAFNFGSLLSSEKTDTKESTEEKKTSGGVPLDLRIKSLNLNNAKIIYSDLRDNIKVDINNLHLSVENFSFYKPFDINFSFNPYFKQNDIVIDEGKIALSAEVDLKELDLTKAYLNLKQLLIDYKEAVFKAKTKVNNFEDPSIIFDMELKNFSNETLSAFTNISEFDLPLVKVKGNLDYFIQKGKMNIKDLLLTSQDSELDFKGNLDFAKEFKMKSKFTLKGALESLSEFYPPLKEYKLNGQIAADFDFNWPLALSGKCDLTEAGFFIKQAGTFKDLNTSIEVKNIDEVKIEQLNGILNKNPFTAKATYQKKKDYADVFFDFKADKLYLIDTSEKEETAQEQTEQETQAEVSPQQNTEEKSSFVPININAKIDIAKLDMPYLRGNKLLFIAKAKNITSQMDQTHGTFELTIQEGQIKDVYTLANANALTKVMFMSLSIVSKVINTLNVLDLLNGMGKLIIGKKIDESDEEDIIKHQKINGKMDFDSFQTLVDFNDGLATMKKCSFVSNLFSFRVNGNINFDTRVIKLNVDSAPGKHTEDGMMPLNIDIKGTVEDPKGSLSVISSVSSLVTDTVKNNPVSNLLKGTWGMLFSSDKKEEEKATSEQETQEDNPKPEQEPKENQE